MKMIFLYHFLWTLLSLLILPIGLCAGNRRFRERLGFDLPEPRFCEGTIWIHALSVGEVISAIPLVETLRERYPEKGVVFSVTTTKGIKIAQAELAEKVHAIFTMPVDFWWSFRRMARYIRPSIFIFIETDMWPGLVDHLKRKGVKVILANGKISPSTFRLYRAFPVFPRLLFKPIDFCLMQSGLDSARLLKAGVEPEKVQTVGNIKFDRHWVSMSKKEHSYWLNLLGLGDRNLIWVAGSTHEGEENIVLQVFKRLRYRYPSLRLVIAPRKIERAGEVLREVKDIGLKVTLRTQMPVPGGPCDIVILDTLGELDRVYGIATISFVGGSLIPDGGHNLLEPASFGCPVLFGPYMHDFATMAESLEKAGAGWRVEDEEGLLEAVKQLLESSQRREKMGMLAKDFITRNQGVLERIMAYIETLCP
ncbi:MAG: 3-deoxy-D-manno-octulosonic acid transferase [Deltaproteobacteria bacterium]|jgi:3-deoxy-D-manno-octulosonic-acid transferase|nr:3-deoxy-D-manno-octulosonic acid transferase [Deltaproteobacteria bacterium]